MHTPSRLCVALLLLLGATPSTQPVALTGVFPVRWSHPDMDKTPSGVSFHGPFFNESVTVSAERLPSHDWLAISIDLFILRSWDGSVDVPMDGKRSPDGPDYFRAGLTGGPTLLFTTFANNPPDDPNFNPDGKSQNFPSFVPGEHFRSQTGSAEHNTLGYNYPWPGPAQLIPEDAVYRLRFVVPHHANEVAIQLSAQGLSRFIDENWGVKDVEIRPLSAAEVPAQDEGAIAKAFADAVDVKGANQADAPALLVLGNDATVNWIAQNVKPQPIDAAQVAKLIEDMEGDDTKRDQREAAAPALMALGPQVEVFIRDLRRTAPGELRTRCDTVLTYIGVHQIDDEDIRRLMLATRVLEIIGTPKAMELRKTLVSGAAAPNP